MTTTAVLEKDENCWSEGLSLFREVLGIYLLHGKCGNFCCKIKWLASFCLRRKYVTKILRIWDVIWGDQSFNSFESFWQIWLYFHHVKFYTEFYVYARVPPGWFVQMVSTHCLQVSPIFMDDNSLHLCKFQIHC